MFTQDQITDIDKSLVQPSTRGVKPAKEVSKQVEAIGNVAAIWVSVKPILQGVKLLLVFKPKWGEAIDKFITAIDGWTDYVIFDKNGFLMQPKYF